MKKLVFTTIDSVTQEIFKDEVSSIEQEELMAKVSDSVMDDPDALELLHYFKSGDGDSAVISVKYGPMLICGVVSAGMVSAQ